MPLTEAYYILFLLLGKKKRSKKFKYGPCKYDHIPKDQKQYNFGDYSRCRFSYDGQLSKNN